jgi:8-oxo-dGTP diphosphatase
VAGGGTIDTGSDEIIRAAGVVLVRAGTHGAEVAVIHRPHRDDWSLPKGKNDPDEHDAVTAVRETREETGFTVILEAGLSRQTYEEDGIPKSVSYWRARSAGGEFIPNPEADELRWLDLDGARDLLTYPDDADTVAEALAVGPTRPLVILRHGKAFARSDWTESDDARPLSPVGQAQADNAAVVLALFAISDIRSSPSRRCQDTVLPLSQHIGVPLVLDPRWSEQAVTASAHERRSAFGDAFESPNAIVVCTHRPNLEVLAEDLDSSQESAFATFSKKLSPGQAWVLHRSPTAPWQVRSVNRLRF